MATAKLPSPPTCPGCDTSDAVDYYFGDRRFFCGDCGFTYRIESDGRIVTVGEGKIREVEVSPPSETSTVTLSNQPRSRNVRRSVARWKRSKDPVVCGWPCSISDHEGFYGFAVPTLPTCEVKFAAGTDRGDGKPVEPRSPTGDNIFPKHLHEHRVQASEGGGIVGVVVHRWDDYRAHGYSLERLGSPGPVDISEVQFDRFTSQSKGTRVMAEEKKASPKAAPKGAAKKPTAPKAKAAKPSKGKAPKAAGGPRKQSRWTPETVAKVRKLHDEGKSIAEISKATKVPEGTVGGMVYRYKRYPGARPGATN